MPPRLQLLSRASTISQSSSYQPIAPFLYPSLQSSRSVSILENLQNIPSSYGHRIRRGRGPSSGKGKTSGRGHKGQGQHGKVPAGFNGGQTPDWVVSGHRGFKNAFSVNMAPINLNRIQYWIDKGRIDPSQPITLKELSASNCVNRVRDGIKLLARGATELTSPINIVVSRASAAAIAAVEKAGGTVTTRYYTPYAIIKIQKGEMDPINSIQSRLSMIKLEDGAEEDLAAETSDVAAALATDRKSKYKYRLPDPTSRKDLEYYRDSARRGYLSYLVKKDQSPSLFFKTPQELEKLRAGRKTGTKSVAKAVEKLW